MSFMRTNTPLKVFLVVSIFTLFTTNATAFYCFNGSDLGFDKTAGITASLSGGSLQSNSIQGYVVEGASYFLKSYSDFLLFFNEIEVSELEGVNYEDIQSRLTNAIEKMEYAREVYIGLTEKAAVTPYNPTVIAKLLDFNYDLFRKKNNLIEPVFKDVRFYLSKGKIREMYGRGLLITEEILEKAKAVKAKFDVYELPDASMLYDLSELCSRSFLFGRYVARVFWEIKQSN